MSILSEMFDFPGDGPNSPSGISPASWIDEALESPSDNYGGHRMDGYHPSFIAKYSCLNAYWHHFLHEVKDSFSPRTYRIFHNGDDVHSRLQRYLHDHLYGTWQCTDCRLVYNEHRGYLDWLNASGHSHQVHSASDTPAACPPACPVCGCETLRYMEWRVIDTERKIVGKMDGVFRSGEEFIGWEIKSANIRTFNALSPTSKYAGIYKRQFSLYLRISGFSSGIITVECKDNQKLTDIPVGDVLENTREIIELVDMSNALIQYNESPPTPERNADCQNCPYLGHLCRPRPRQ